MILENGPPFFFRTEYLTIVLVLLFIQIVREPCQKLVATSIQSVTDEEPVAVSETLNRYGRLLSMNVTSLFFVTFPEVTNGLVEFPLFTQ